MIFKKYILIFFLIFITNCDGFKRFDQEKYSCTENELSISQIDILKTNAIKKAYATISGEEFILKINSYSKTEIVLSINDIYITIKRDINEISVSLGNKIFFLSCKIEQFKI